MVRAAPPQARLLVDEGRFVLDARSAADWAVTRVLAPTRVTLAAVFAGVGSHVVQPLLVVTRQGGSGRGIAAYLGHQGIQNANPGRRPPSTPTTSPSDPYQPISPIGSTV